MRHANDQRNPLPHLCAAAALAACLVPGTALALFTVNFEQDGMANNIQHGQVIDDEYLLANGGIVDSNSGAVVGMSVNVTNGGGGPDLGVAFDTRENNTADPDLEAPFSVPNGFAGDEITNPGNILIVQENSTGCDDGVCNSPDDEGGGPNTVTFQFTSGVELFSVDLFDIDGTSANPDESVELVLSDSAGAVLFSTTEAGVGNNNAVRVDFNTGIMNVAKLVATFSSSGALGNIRGQIPGTAVPAPAPIALVAAGLLLFAARRRRQPRSGA